MPTNTENDFLQRLRKLREQRSLSSGDRKATLKEWTAAVRTLCEQLHGWLQSAEEQDLLKVVHREFDLEEDALGAYELDGLEIRLPNGGTTITVEPVARFVVAGSGRIDVHSGARRAAIVRRNDSLWEIGGRAPAFPFATLDQDTFLKALTELLG